MVTQAALESRTLFRSDRDRFVYLALTRRAAGRFAWRVHGYCLLSDRTHLVLSAPSPDALDGGVRCTRRAYASYLRADRGDRRRLWQSGYGRQALEGDRRRRALACIELEPVRTALAGTVEEFVWSSGAAHLGAARPYIPLDEIEGTVTEWKTYLEETPGDFEYWRILRWMVAPEFTPGARSQREGAEPQSEPEALQASLAFAE